MIALLPLLFLTVLSNDDGFDTIQEQSPEERAQELLEERLAKEKDTVYYTCIVLTRMHLGNYGGELLEIVQNQSSFDEQQSVWKKMYANHAQLCSNHLTYEDSIAILSQLKNDEFDHKRLPSLFSDIDFNSYRQGTWNREFDDEENLLWRYIEEFESSFAENKHKNKERETDEIDDLEYLKFAASKIQQKKSASYDLSGRVQKTNFTDILFLILAFTSIVAGMYVVVKRLQQQVDADSNKKKKK